MRLPKISAIREGISDALHARRLQRMREHVRIHDIDTYADSFAELYNAKEILGNYAISKGVVIDVYRGERFLPELYKEKDSKFLHDKLCVKVTDKKSGKNKIGLIGADTDKTYTHQTTVYTFEDTSDETQIVKKHVFQTADDNFLRNFYRKVAKMTNELKQRIKQYS